MTQDEMEFLYQVRSWIAEKPQRMGMLVSAATAGIEDQLAKAHERLADMEVVAAMALNGRVFGGQKLLIAEKLRKYSSGRTALSWTTCIAELEKGKKNDLPMHIPSGNRQSGG